MLQMREIELNMHDTARTGTGCVWILVAHDYPRVSVDVNCSCWLRRFGGFSDVCGSAGLGKDSRIRKAATAHL